MTYRELISEIINDPSINLDDTAIFDYTYYHNASNSFKDISLTPSAKYYDTDELPRFDLISLSSF